MITSGTIVLAPFAYDELDIASTPEPLPASAFGFRPTPICLTCKRTMRLVIRNAHAEVGVGAVAAIWACAVYECIHCQYRILADFSTGPICRSTSACWDEWRRDLRATEDRYFVIGGAG